MTRSLPLAAALLACELAPATARATCMQRYTCRPVLPDCTVHVKQEPQTTYPDQPPNEIELWPANRPISFVQELTTCCHAPGGIGGCSSELRADTEAPADRAKLVTWNEEKQTAETVRDRITTGRLACLDIPLYTFAGKVPEGDYRIDCLGGGTIKVVAPAEFKRATTKNFAVTPPVQHGEPPRPPPEDSETTTPSEPPQSTTAPELPPPEQPAEPPPLASKSGCRQTPNTPAPLALLGLVALTILRRARKHLP
jgi:hypothetical protein